MKTLGIVGGIAPESTIEYYRQIIKGYRRHSRAGNGILKETPMSFDSSTHTLWDSGELQKEIGSKNKDKKKIVMRVWCEYKRLSPVTYSWQILYSLKAENKNLTGSGWHEVGDLYGITYDVIYTLGGNAPKAENGFKSHNGGGTAMGQIASGTSSLALPNFTTNRFTGNVPADQVGSISTGPETNMAPNEALCSLKAAGFS